MRVKTLAALAATGLLAASLSYADAEPSVLPVDDMNASTQAPADNNTSTGATTDDMSTRTNGDTNDMNADTTTGDDDY